MVQFTTRVAALLLLTTLALVFGACQLEGGCLDDSPSCAEQSGDSCFCHAAVVVPVGVEPIAGPVSSVFVSQQQALILPGLPDSIFNPPRV